MYKLLREQEKNLTILTLGDRVYNTMQCATYIRDFAIFCGTQTGWRSPEGCVFASVVICRGKMIAPCHSYFVRICIKCKYNIIGGYDKRIL